MVAQFENVDDANPFDPIRLRGTITSLFDYDVSKNGILSAAIEYHTPYRYNISSRSLVPTWEDIYIYLMHLALNFPCISFKQNERQYYILKQILTLILHPLR